MHWLASSTRAKDAWLQGRLASGYIDEELRAQAGEAGVRELIFKADAAEDLCAALHGWHRRLEKRRSLRDLITF